VVGLRECRHVSLRSAWYREFIAELEANRAQAWTAKVLTVKVFTRVSATVSTHWVCLQSDLVSKSCIGPRLISGVVCQALMNYEAQSTGGTIRSIERAGSRTRYTASTQNPAQAIQATPRLKAALEAFAPSQDSISIGCATNRPLRDPAGGYSLRLEIDASSLPRHKTNLILLPAAGLIP